ncbi:serine/threonine-protein kinase, partial [Thermoleptolyngbya sp. M55_K2018_002]|uniref:serine/threonine-protein kinase n=1 Tax=Thermoleptolyngbya sp. M55_K2018_002 TaxID=2747808 RepID=UPI0019F93FAA
MSLYCSQGHANTPGSRFCNWCGEALSTAAGGQELLGDRYKIVRELGHGGFGRTYLAEDQNRFRESCVLKEFAPQVQSSYALQKAEELFQREAGVLYQLQHPQIPRFRELCRTQFNGKPSLFLVQDYVDGPTYRQLLDQRRLQGKTFSEAEVTQLMRDLLPVLHYIHSLGVVHRDIAPDNLILRTADQLPVLIDFGGVKQVAASVASQYTPSAPTPTRVGKVGYAPDEQMDHGQVYAHSDLYALAVTVLVLLTGKEPGELGDLSAGTWWQGIKLSPTLSRTLMKMLADSPRDRFQTAAEVLQALQPLPGANPSLLTPPGTLPPAAYPSP